MKPGNVETIGIPTITPSECVQLRALGPKLDGIYNVLKVTHRIGTSGFTSQLELRSGTADLLAQVFKTQAGANQNTNEATEKNSSNTTSQAKSDPGEQSK